MMMINKEKYVPSKLFKILVIISHFIFPIPFVFSFYLRGEAIGWEAVLDKWVFYLLIFLCSQAVAGMFTSLMWFIDAEGQKQERWEEEHRKWKEENLIFKKGGE